MHHAVGAFLVIARAVFVPVRVLHQLLESLGVALAEQIAGALPAEYRPGRVAPRRAVIGLIAGEKIEEQTRLEQRPAWFSPSASEHVPEQLLGPRAIEEMLLVRRALIGIAGRQRDAIDTERHDAVEELGHPRRLGIAEQRAVDIHPEAFHLGRLYGDDGAVIDSRLANRPVVHLLVAIEMHRPIEPAVRLISVELLLHQQRIGADGNIFALGESALDDLGKLFVEQRLTAREHDDRGPAFVDCLHAIGNRQSLVQYLVRIIDLAAARTSEVTAKQRLQHQHQRVTLSTLQMLAQNVRPNG